MLNGERRPAGAEDQVGGVVKMDTAERRRRRMKKLAIGLWGAVLGAALSAAAGDAWVTDFEQAKKLAAEKKLPIIANFSGSDWCGWCIKLDKEVFSQPAFQEYASSNAVLFVADFPRRKEQPAEEKKQNEQLAERYGVEGFPTVLLLDSKGKVIGQTEYKPGGAEKYVEHLKALLQKRPEDKTSVSSEGKPIK
jgi:protein disulfide-isomerase